MCKTDKKTSNYIISLPRELIVDFRGDMLLQMSKTICFDGTRADALSENSFFEIVWTSPFTGLPIKARLTEFLEIMISRSEFCSKQYCSISSQNTNDKRIRLQLFVFLLLFQSFQTPITCKSGGFEKQAQK